jgi:hypothetical protein
MSEEGNRNLPFGDERQLSCPSAVYRSALRSVNAGIFARETVSTGVNPCCLLCDLYGHDLSFSLIYAGVALSSSILGESMNSPQDLESLRAGPVLARTMRGTSNGYFEYEIGFC